MFMFKTLFVSCIAFPPISKVAAINNIQLSEPSQWLCKPLLASVFASVGAEVASVRVLFFLSQTRKEKLSNYLTSYLKY